MLIQLSCEHRLGLLHKRNTVPTMVGTSLEEEVVVLLQIFMAVHTNWTIATYLKEVEE